MKKVKHYSFMFRNNSGDTVAIMTLATPVKLDVFELGDDLSMALIHQLGININTKVTVDTID